MVRMLPGVTSLPHYLAQQEPAPSSLLGGTWNRMDLLRSLDLEESSKQCHFGRLWMVLLC